MRHNHLISRICVEPSSLLNGQTPFGVDHSVRSCNYALFTSYRARLKLCSTTSSHHSRALSSIAHTGPVERRRWSTVDCFHDRQQRCYAQQHDSKEGDSPDESTDFLLEHHTTPEASGDAWIIRRVDSRRNKQLSKEKPISENVRPLFRRVVGEEVKPIPTKATTKRSALQRALYIGKLVEYKREELPWRKQIQAARLQAKATSTPINYITEPIQAPITRRYGTLKQERPWASSQQETQDIPAEELLDREISAFSEYIRSTKAQIVDRWSIAAFLTTYLKNCRPDWHFEVFGSTAAGIATPESDIDIAATPRGTSDHRTKLLDDVEASIKSAQQGLIKEFKCLNTEPGRFPLLNLKHIPSGLQIQITAGRKVFQRGFLPEIIQTYPHLRDLYYIIRTVLDIRHLNKVFYGGIGSYAILMMILAYLKRRKHDPDDTAAQQLAGFLNFYGQLNTTKFGISAKSGALFCKHDFDDPTEMGRLHDAARRRSVKARNNAWMICERDQFAVWRICLQDGVFDGLDVTQKAYAYKHIRSVFQGCHTDLQRFANKQSYHSSPLELLVGPCVDLYFNGRHRQQRRLALQNSWTKWHQQVRKQFDHGLHHHQHVWPDDVETDDDDVPDYVFRSVTTANDSAHSNEHAAEPDLTYEDEQELTELGGQEANAGESDNESDLSSDDFHDLLSKEQDGDDLTGEDLEKLDMTIEDETDAAFTNELELFDEAVQDYTDKKENRTS